MICENPTYCEEMLKRGRLMPIIINNERFAGWISFYIGYKNEEAKYKNDNLWNVLDDDVNGDVCFVNKLITDNNPENPKYAFQVWRRFRTYIKANFPNVKTFYWDRWKECWGKAKVRRIK